ncbi:MAG: zeta toxin family protein, partial [Pseudomonadota bacterium]
DLTFELKQIEEDIVGQAISSPRPFLLHMLGIPGAGKTTFLEILQQNWTKEHGTKLTLLGFDQVMQALPSYQLNPDKPSAFAAFELPARAAGYSILESLLAKKASILFDNGGSAASHPAFF